MNKHSVIRAIARLEDQAVVNYEATAEEKSQSKADARLVRRFLNAERQEIIILRRWVLLAASRLEEAFLGADTSDGLIAELRTAATPKREKRK